MKRGNTTKRKRKNKNKTVRFQLPPSPKNDDFTLKVEKCSPYSKGRGVVPKSCFTKGTLLDLKNTYNQHNVDKITSNKPKEIHKSIQQRIPHCKKESCWVQHVAKPDVKNKLLSLLFAPPQPDEWKKNPNSWLSNYDILGVLKQYEQTFRHFYFIGPSPIDYDYRKPDQQMRCVCPNICNFNLSEIYTKGIRKVGVIFNLDKHTEGGSHWVSLFIDIEEKLIFYFDSTSDPVPSEIARFIEKVKTQGHDMTPKIHFKHYENRKAEHQIQDNECGMYSLFFIITMLVREKDGKKLSTKDAIGLFLGKKGRITDKQMNELRDDYFNESTE